MPEGAPFSHYGKRKHSKRVVPRELRTGIGHSYGIIILCAIYTVGEKAEKLRGREGILDSRYLIADCQLAVADWKRLTTKATTPISGGKRNTKEYNH